MTAEEIREDAGQSEESGNHGDFTREMSKYV